jgi:hypothetical protein
MLLANLGSEVNNRSQRRQFDIASGWKALLPGELVTGSWDASFSRHALLIKAHGSVMRCLFANCKSQPFITPILS